MQISDSTKTHLGWGLFFGTVAGFLAIHGIHALGEGEDLETFIYGILFPISISIGLVFGGLKVWQTGWGRDYSFRIAGSTIGGAVVLANAGVLVVLYEHAEGVAMSDPIFVIVNSATGGALVGFVIGIYDIRRRIARDEAHQLNQQLTVLNRVLRHDIRTKATTIKGHAELLNDETDSVTRISQTIQSETADLVELGEYAKDLEKLFHDQDAERETVNLTPIVETYCDDIRRNYPAVEMDVSLRDREMVSAHSMIALAIKSVIENAVQHNDIETPTLEISARKATTNETDIIELRIEDNGPGIPHNEIEVLKRGYETDLDHSSGLGLWIVNWIVSESNGEIRFEENEPRGSVVKIRLPTAEQGRNQFEKTDTVEHVESELSIQ